MVISRGSRMCLLLGLLAGGTALSFGPRSSTTQSPPRLCHAARRHSVGFSHCQKPTNLLVGKLSAALVPVDDPPPSSLVRDVAAVLSLLLLGVLSAVQVKQGDMLVKQVDMLVKHGDMLVAQAGMLASLSSKFDNVAYFVAGIVALATFGSSVVKILEYLDDKAADKAKKGPN